MNYKEFREYAYYKIKLKDVLKLGIKMYLDGDLIATDSEIVEFIKKYGRAGIADYKEVQKHLDSIL